jgi:sporulation protein YlmC with PRC-barrel domain
MSVSPSTGATASLIPADKVEGTDVYNSQGEHLGHIEDVMIHKVSGRVAYAIMSFGGFLGIGAKYHPVPWSMLKYDEGKGGYVVPLDRSLLEKAPFFDEAELRDDDRSWRDTVHTYYSAPPYWG